MIAAELRVWRRCLIASIRSQAGHPTAFLLQAAAQLANTLVGFAGVAVLMARFGSLRGWTLAELGVFFGVVTTAFGLCDAFTRGFDVFGPDFVKTAAFDRVLLRPRFTAVQIAAYEFRLAALGRAVQGLAVLAWAIWAVGGGWTAAQLILLAWAGAGTVAAFAALLLLQATLTFWTIETVEAANIATHGGMEAGQYPLDAFAPWFRRVMLSIIPIGLVCYLPLTLAMRRDNLLHAPAWACAAGPLAGFAFLAVALWAWGFGVRRYASAGG